MEFHKKLHLGIWGRKSEPNSISAYGVSSLLFIVNRMQSAMTREVLYLVENGYSTPEEIDLAVKTSLMPRGLMLGLVERMDFNGIDMIANGKI